MIPTKVTMKKMPEKRFRVKVNKCAAKKDVQISCMGNIGYKC